MLKSIYISFCGLLIGFSLGFLYLHSSRPDFGVQRGNAVLSSDKNIYSPQVVGFLPYWLISKAKADYSSYITTLTYFGLTLDTDGSILRFTKPGEGEPGWVSLNSGKMQTFFDQAAAKNVKLSLLMFLADDEKITNLLEDPDTHAQNMIREISPILKHYGFSDVNIDIENVSSASESSSLAFTQFLKSVKDDLKKEGNYTLTADVTGSDLVRKKLIDIPEVSKIVDYLVIMGYDYHYPGSSVTGPVSPLYGAGDIAEYDIDTAVNAALSILPPEKVILGIPLYGYEWETLKHDPRSAVIPMSGATVSNFRAEEIIKTCTTCNYYYDELAQERYIISETPTHSYRQIFYPDRLATQAKVDYAIQKNIGGIALWALGYEGKDILQPLTSYKSAP